MAKDVRYLTIRVELERTGGEPADPFDVANELIDRVEAVDQVVVARLDGYGYPERTSVYTVKGAVLHRLHEEYDREERSGGLRDCLVARRKGRGPNECGDDPRLCRG